MKKIGIMGGTFDPIHMGHVMLGATAKVQFGLDKVLFMPTGNPAYKTEGHQVTSGIHRAAMVQLAISGYEGLEFSDMELRRRGNTYTADTLTALRAAEPDIQYYYIVGADSLDYMDRWHCPRMIFQNAVILAARRVTQSEEQFQDTIVFLQKKYQADIRLLEAPRIDISSSDLRYKISNGTDVSEWVEADVLQYIKKHHLYEPEGSG